MPKASSRSRSGSLGRPKGQSVAVLAEIARREMQELFASEIGRSTYHLAV